MGMNPRNDEAVLSDGEEASTKNVRLRDRAETKKQNNDRNGKTAPATEGARKAGMPIRTSLAHTYQPQRSSKGSNTVYIVVGASVFLSGLLALYVSMMTKTAWAPVPESEISFESTPVAASMPLLPEKPASIDVVVPSQGNPKSTIIPNAVIDVPGVSLRNAPDVSGKTVSNSLKRGERVEIRKRVSGNGPAWVKIATKTGKTGWVFASVVRKLGRG